MSEHYCWKDGMPLFFTSLQHLRLIQSLATEDPHVGIAKWQRYNNWQYTQQMLWSAICKSFRSTKHNALAWQVAYRIIATNKWRFPKLLDLDQLKACATCRPHVLVDVNHVVWGCPQANRIWKWSTFMLQLMDRDDSQVVCILVTKAFLGEPLATSPSKKWWLLSR